MDNFIFSIFTPVPDVPKCPCPPVITKVLEESDTNINITWTHPCDKPPTTRYIVTTLPLSTGIFFTTQPASHITVPSESTSTTITGIERADGKVYIFVVTAVSGDVSQSSQPAHFKIRTYIHVFNSLQSINIANKTMITVHFGPKAFFSHTYTIYNCQLKR